MKLLFLDIYKKSNSRISKDTAGGYGTENDLGDGIFGRLLSLFVKHSIFWPNLSFVQLFEEFTSRGHECHFRYETGDIRYIEEHWDAVFVCSSIVCFETEIKAIRDILRQRDVPIFLCGSVAKYIQNEIPPQTCVLAGNYEFLPQQLENNGSSLFALAKERVVNVVSGNPASLVLIDWSRQEFAKNKNRLLGNKNYFIPFIATRGCPYSCREYCTYPTTQGVKVLQEQSTSTIQKLRAISKKYPGAHVVFRDPVFSINIKNAKKLLKEIGDQQLSLDFSAELHLKNIDDEFIQLCKYANITGLKFGIESAHETVRNDSKRFSVSNDQQKTTITKLKKAGIRTVGMFILAQPSDDRSTCLSTIDYACNLGLDLAQFSIFTPYPGTPFFDRGETNRAFSNYEECNQYNLVYDHPTISKKEARDLLQTAYMSFVRKKIKNSICSLLLR